MSYDSNANYDCPMYSGALVSLIYRVFQRQWLHSQLSGHSSTLDLAGLAPIAARFVTSSQMRQDNTVSADFYSLSTSWKVSTKELVTMLYILQRLSICAHSDPSLDLRIYNRLGADLSRCVSDDEE